MNKTELLDEILLMLRTFKDDRERLEQLHRYIRDELYIEHEPEAVIIPERYRALVKGVADRLSANMVCYINPDTLEMVELFKTTLDERMFEAEEDKDDDEDPFYDLKRIERDWKHVIAITPPESHVSFSFMEQFVNSLKEGRLKKALSEVLSGRKPFRHFNHIIHQSDARNDWFTFRQKCLEHEVAGILSESLWSKES